MASKNKKSADQADRPKRRKQPTPPQSEEAREAEIIASELAEVGVTVVIDPEVDEALKETCTGPEAASTDSDTGLLEPEIPQTESGLLVYHKGEYREPTEAELLEMGRAMVKGFLGYADAVEVLDAVAAMDKPPAPKLSTPHCRTCNYWRGNDPRGALWSSAGKCSAITPSPDVEPEYYCTRFIFNEGLRDGA